MILQFTKSEFDSEDNVLAPRNQTNLIGVMSDINNSTLDSVRSV